MDQKTVMKVGISVVGLMSLAFGQSYTQNPDAKLMVHVATVLVAVGSYLVGLYQTRPGK